MARQIQPASQRLRSIDGWPSLLEDARRVPGVTAASATVSGAGVATRADARVPIVIRGIEPERFLAIIDLRPHIIEGSFDVSAGRVTLGSTLADDLGIGAGDRLRIESTEGIQDVVTVAGVFTLGTGAVDESWVVTSLRHAQSLFALPGGATTIELTVADVFAADGIADEIHARTGFTADSWMALNAELLEGLSAHSSSKGKRSSNCADTGSARMAATCSAFALRNTGQSMRKSVRPVDRAYRFQLPKLAHRGFLNSRRVTTADH